MPRPVLMVLATLSLACAGLGPRAPGPLVGATQVELVFEGDAPTAAEDVAPLRARFTEAGISAELEVLSPRRLRVRATNARDPDVVRALLAQGRLQIGDEELPFTATRADWSAGDPSPYPTVTVTLDPPSGERLCDLTRANLGQTLALRVDGEQQMAPVVRDPICGGELLIALGAGAADQARDVALLAAVLAHGPLQARWRSAP